MILFILFLDLHSSQDFIREIDVHKKNYLIVDAGRANLEESVRGILFVTS